MKSQVYVDRRNAVRTELNNIPYIISAFDAMQQAKDAAAPFVQEANFKYLTGIDEPGWILCEDNGKSTLVSPDVSEIHRIFDGGLSDSQAKKVSGADAVISYKEFTELFDVFIKAGNEIGALGEDPNSEHYSFVMNPAPLRIIERLTNAKRGYIDIRPVLAKIRSKKQAEEITEIKKAVDLTIEAFETVKKSLTDIKSEYSIDATVTHVFRNNNAHHAYDPIVAGGVNACTLHYQHNSAALPENGLVLMDVGAEVQGYAADITRTYAVGNPSKREIDVHAAVEAAHKRIIDLIKPGVTFKDYHDQVDEIMKTALNSLGLLQKPDDYRKYFPRAISHGLGLDVHESLGRYDSFEPGMVLTVEPGIYIPEEGIGVRIEDDILVTESGNENLSSALSTSL